MANGKIRKITRGNGRHWVGNGFLVNSMFSYDHDELISPFLLLDYAAPTDFEPSHSSRGVDFHPHRGFETVTIVYHGEIEHKDTAGHSGKIGSGDVQWMTAAGGILHEEKHSEAFIREGGKLELIQLWINLPAQYKMSAPRYQEILNQDIPRVTLPDHAGYVRVIAGSFDQQPGAAKTFTPVHLLDIGLNAGAEVTIPVEKNFNTSLLVLSGKLQLSDHMLADSELAFFEPTGEPVTLKAETNTTALLMSGEPIDEPIVSYGPFVMNTDTEIRQAIEDFRSGAFRSTSVIHFSN